MLNPFSQKWWLVLVLGPIYAGACYATFRGACRWLDLKTPGREPNGNGVGVGAAAGEAAGDARLERARRLVLAFGGRENLRALEAVALTRLRAELADPGRFDEAAATRAGVLAVMRAAPRVLHLVVGERADQLAAALAAR